MTIWTPHHLAGGKPIYLGLADAIEADLDAGVLTPGQKLPTHRDLAEALGVTVGTVTRGYAEAARRGLVRGEVGRGTVVSRGLEQGAPWWGHEEHGSAGIDLGLVTGLYALDPDLGAALRTLSARNDLQELLRYQPSRGLRRHREAGAKWAAVHGLKADPEHIVVCAGGQHALVALFTAIFRPGDRVLAAELNYPGLISAANILGLKLVPVACDAEGLIPEALDEACAREAMRGLYVMPCVHNPTTEGMGRARRAEVAELARRHNLLVVEDDAYALTSEKQLAPLAALAPERTFHVAGMSKPLAGGLRIAFVTVPQEHVERVATAVTGTTWMAAPLCAEVASLWIEDGTAEAVVERKRAEAAARNALAAQILAGQDFRARKSGYFLWLSLPEQWRAAEFERAARERGVAVVGGDAFAVGHTAAPMAVRISVSAARDREELRRGLAVLAGLLGEGPGLGRGLV